MTVLTDHLPLTAGAPNGINKLRRLILELATRGRLIPVELPADSEIPVGWIATKLGEKLTFEYGDNLPAAKRSNTGEYPVYGSNGVVGTHDQYFVKDPCIVIGRKGSAGALNICKVSGCCVTDVAYYCVPPEYLSLDYTFKLLQTLGLDELGKGIKPGLSRNEAYQLEILVPPIDEQHRIVAKADELMALCDALEAQQASAEGAHIQLVQALLDSLTQASDAEDFAASWQRLSEHFDTLFTTEASIDALKQAVLQLAVMGKLVPQNSADEPASELLKRNDARRMRLVVEGKLKPAKSVSISNDDMPYVPPPGWEVAPLGNVVDVVRGITFPASEKSKSAQSGRVACLRTANVQAEIEWDDLLFISERYVARAEQYVQPNDIVMSMANSRELVGKVALIGEALKQRTTIGGFLAILRPACIEPKFLMTLLRTPNARNALIDSASQTTNIANVSLGKLRPFPLAIPPLAEQHRIIAKVDELLSLCDRLKAHFRRARALNEQLASTLVERAVA